MAEKESGTRHWLFGDRLGPHFVDPVQDGPHRDAPLLMIEARSVFRRRFHRARAHLALSTMRHRAAEPGDGVRPAECGGVRGTERPRTAAPGAIR